MRNQSRFKKWWAECGSRLPYTGEARAESAFYAGMEVGMAQSRNYVADSSEMPGQVTFANGRVVRIVDNPNPNVHNGVFLQVD
jgi:hypothetical protein